VLKRAMPREPVGRLNHKVLRGVFLILGGKERGLDERSTKRVHALCIMMFGTLKGEHD
jgi:hypothetical protein